MFTPEWFSALCSILLIDLILSGDNAVLIALASKQLPSRERKKAIFLGTAGAVIQRILLTFAVVILLQIPFLQFLGGLALFYIAIHLLSCAEDEQVCKMAHSLKEAIKIILFADLIMSLDNVLALAAIAQTVPDAKYSLIIIGLLISIPLVVFSAQLLTKLMDKFPVFVYIGAGILGYAAAKMMIGDKALAGAFKQFETPFIVLSVIFVLTVGHFKKLKHKHITEKWHYHS
ncbi:MAG: TerC family protein [Pelosinus sp.]|nr:TerC family protein [Pelosinus sp.]